MNYNLACYPRDRKLINCLIVDPKDFTKDYNQEKISSGYSAIDFYTQNATGRKCVIKRTNEPISQEDAKRSYGRERYILSMADHPVIVSFVGFFIKNNFGYLVEEEIEKGDLSKILEKKIDPVLENRFWMVHIS